MEKYAFNFVDYRIVNINFALTGKSPKKIDINPKIEIRHEKKDSNLKVLLALIFENSDAPFVLNIRFAGLFDFGRNIENEDLADIANVNCAAILYPFVREGIADITRRSGFPPLLLPPLNFVELNKISKVAEVED